MTQKEKDTKLNRADWESKYIQDLKAQPKKSSKVQALLDVLANASATSFQKNSAKNILDTAYRAYSIKFDFDKAQKKSDEQFAKLLSAKQSVEKKKVAQSRQERAHELITIGALTEVTNFEKDRGLIAGALLDVLDRINANEQVKWDLKKRGDDLLHEIELEKKSKRERRNKVSSKIAETAEKVHSEVN